MLYDKTISATSLSHDSRWVTFRQMASFGRNLTRRMQIAADAIGRCQRPFHQAVRAPFYSLSMPSVMADYPPRETTFRLLATKNVGQNMKAIMGAREKKTC